MRHHTGEHELGGLHRLPWHLRSHWGGVVAKLVAGAIWLAAAGVLLAIGAKQARVEHGHTDVCPAGTHAHGKR